MTAVGWLLWLGTLAVELNPIVQLVSLVLASVASAFAIVFYWKRLHGGE
jgi:hypothetical protein